MAFSDQAQSLAVAKAALGPRWSIAAPSHGSVAKVSYSVNLTELEQGVAVAVDASRARQDYCLILGYSVLGYVLGLENLPANITISTNSDWPVFSTLSPSATTRGTVSGSAPDFYALADSQAVLGSAALIIPIAAQAAPLFYVVYAEGKGQLDPDLVTVLVHGAFDDVTAYYEVIPYPHYAIVMELLEPYNPNVLYGFSMEHLQSASINVEWGGGVTNSSQAADIAEFRFNLAHHMSHAWIPKRVYGPHYRPFIWEMAPTIDSIWFNEGFGQYNAIAASADGLPPAEGKAYQAFWINHRFTQMMAQWVPPLMTGLELNYLSGIASTQYSGDFRIGIGTFCRGGLMAAEMDSAIRNQTAGAKTLRDGVRALVNWALAHPAPISMDNMVSMIRDSTGVEVHSIYKKWLAPIPSDGR